MEPAPHTVESLFEELFDGAPHERAEFYVSHDVPGALAGLVEELFAAHAVADFELPSNAAPELEAVRQLEEPDAQSRLGHALGGRYRLEVVLGEGTYGAVYRATDLGAGTGYEGWKGGATVAIKVPSSAPLAKAVLEREAACLRCLEEGVAPLISRGMEAGVPFLVLAHVNGGAFPKAESVASSLRPKLVIGLAQSLAAVHRQGVVHRDVKPDNVLVTQEGRVVLIDFGIAHGPAFAAPGVDRSLSLGTDVYASPEQLKGLIGDARSDVYSCALMGLELLTGLSAKELRLRAVGDPPKSLQPRDAETVEYLFDVVVGDHQGRAGHAGALLSALQGGDDRAGRDSAFSDHIRGVLLGGDASCVFGGLEPLLHLRSGAARELRRRVGEDSDAALLEIESWIDRGLAFRRGDRIQLHAPGLDVLRAEAVGAGPLERASAGEIVGATPELREALLASVAERRSALEREGFSGRAEVLLVKALGIVRDWPMGSQEAEGRLLPWLVRLSVQRATVEALDRAAFDVARSRLTGTAQSSLESALELTHASVRGDYIGATATLFSVPAEHVQLEARMGWAALEAAVISHQVRASFSLLAPDDHEAGGRLRRSATRRARTQMRDRFYGGPEDAPLAARRCLWSALRAYRLGHFVRAARLHRRAAELSEITYDVASSLLNAASSSMEAWEFAPALEDVEAALARLESAPFPTLEARAIWTRRTLQLRSGGLPEVDRSLDQAFTALGSPRLLALHTLNEAATAYLRGDSSRAASQARLSHVAWSGLKSHPAAALARSIALAAGDPWQPSDDALFGSLTASVEPSLGLQIAALSKRARSACQGQLEAWCGTFRPAPDGCRFDVLDTHEIATELGIAQPGEGSRPMA